MIVGPGLDRVDQGVKRLNIPKWVGFSGFQLNPKTPSSEFETGVNAWPGRSGYLNLDIFYDETMEIPVNGNILNGIEPGSIISQ